MTTLIILTIGLIVYLSFIFYIKSLKVDKEIEVKPGEFTKIEKEKGEFPSSISKSFYLAKQWIFTSFMTIECGIVIAAIQSLLGYSKVSWEGMLGAVFLTLVPAFGYKGYKLSNTFHKVGATVGFILIISMFWITFGHWYISIFGLIVAVYTYYKHKEDKLTFWIENNLILFVMFGGLFVEALIKMLSL